MNLIFYPPEFVTCSLQLANLSCNNKINFVLINTGLVAVLKKTLFKILQLKSVKLKEIEMNTMAKGVTAVGLHNRYTR